MYKGVHEFRPEVRGDCYTAKFDMKHPESIEKSMYELKEKFKNQLREYI